MIFKDY